MKLQSTLPESVGFLHAVPVINIFALLLMCYLLGPQLEEKTGITVQAPTSLFQMERFQEAAIITMTANGSSQMYLGKSPVTFVQLEKALQEQAEAGLAERGSIVIMADRVVSSESLRQVAEACMRRGFRVVLAGGTLPASTDPETP